MKQTCLAVLFCFLLVSSADAQDLKAASPPSNYALHVYPGLGLPLGADRNFFGPGGALDVGLTRRFARIPFLNLGLGLGYDLLPVQASTSLSVVSLSAQAGAEFTPFPGLSALLFARGGYFYGLFNEPAAEQGHNPTWAAGLQVQYRLLPRLSLGVAGTYRVFYGLYNGLGLSLGSTYHLPVSERSRLEGWDSAPRPLPLGQIAELKNGKGLEITSAQLDGVYPVFYKYYDTHAVGRITLRNFETLPAEDIKISVFVKQYMDNPKAQAVIRSLRGKSEVEVPLFGLFTNAVLEITENTKVSTTVDIEYLQNGQTGKKRYIGTLDILDRNAMSWDDDRKAAAFVTYKDPAVLKFAKNLSSVSRDLEVRSVSRNLLQAMRIHGAFGLAGFHYVVDPSSPYPEYSANKLAVDYLQFPSQTMEYKSGDCDDLSILYCSCFEAVGIETAFITIPGHIYMAFALELAPEEVRRLFDRTEEILFLEGKAWVPLEVTMLRGSLLDAWSTGARQWRDNQNGGTREFLPLHKAWEVYEPVGFAGAAADLAVPAPQLLAARVQSESDSFVSAQIAGREKKLLEEISQARDATGAINRLGVLYSRFGLFEKAKVQFRRALEKKEDTACLFNLGNIHFLLKELGSAQDYYRRALANDPENPRILAAMVRVSHSLGDARLANELLAKLSGIDANSAEKLAYVRASADASTKAADSAETDRRVEWLE